MRIHKVKYKNSGFLLLILISISCSENLVEKTPKKSERVRINYKTDQTKEFLKAIKEKLELSKENFKISLTYHNCWSSTEYNYIVTHKQKGFVQIEGFNRKDSKVKWRSSNRISFRNQFIQDLEQKIEEVDYCVAPAGFYCASKLIDKDTLEFNTLRINLIESLIK